MMFTDEDLASEEWRPVVGWEGYYEVSSLGRVRRKERIVECVDGRKRFLESKLLNIKKSKSGFSIVRLFRNRAGKYHHVHSIVADAFIDNPDGLTEVVHVNGDLDNNRVANLSRSRHMDHLDAEIRQDNVNLPTLDGDDGCEWRPVVGFEGYYEVSSNGLVRSLRRTVAVGDGVAITLPGRIMTVRPDDNGYPKVALAKDGKPCPRMVHRLMAEAFIPNPDRLRVVTHVNGIRDDNRLENLMWTTYSDTHETYVSTTERESEIIAAINEWKSRNPEEWRPVSGYEGMYDISNWGNVKSLSRISVASNGRVRNISEKLLKPIVDPNGYQLVTLCKEGKGTRVRIHRLVAEAFVENVESKPFVDHINGMRDDNRDVNLRWCTRDENNENRVHDGSRPKAKPADGETVRDTLPGEEWRHVNGYDDLYDVSSLGRIWKRPNETVAVNGDIFRNGGKFLNGSSNNNGYVCVQLQNEGKRVAVVVHRIVAEAFLPNPTGAVRLRHINKDRADNRVENLEWIVSSYSGRIAFSNCNVDVLPGEEWRDVRDFEELYQVSSFGRVRSLKRPNAQCGLMRPAMSSSGYPMVHLSKDGRAKNYFVHRLVAEAFIPNPDCLEVVNHKDEDKGNARVENLEWVSFEDNVRYGTAIERAEKARNHKSMKKPVLQFDMDGAFVRWWPSMSEVHRMLGISFLQLRLACNKTGCGSTESGVVSGYRWYFEEDYPCVG